MKQSQGRFPSPAAQQLVHLHKNLYVNRHDPKYHEKVIRYLDPHSPEAHYRLGQHFDQKGLKSKALYHYKQSMKVYPSPYYYQASGAIRRLEQNAAAGAATASGTIAGPTPEQRAERAFPLFLKVLVMTLFMINIALLLIFFAPSAISKAVTVLSPFTVGKSVTYESVEKPFLLHFPHGEPNRKVEDELHQKAIKLAEAYPNAHIVIYGIASSAAGAEQKAVPLTNDDWKRQAFVVAEYNPAIDQAVKIRFVHPELTAVGANIVRTALNAYISEHGTAPPRLDDLLQDYPNNYMSFLPAEGQSGSALVRTFFLMDRAAGFTTVKRRMRRACFTRTRKQETSRFRIRPYSWSSKPRSIRWSCEPAIGRSPGTASVSVRTARLRRRAHSQLATALSSPKDVPPAYTAPQRSASAALPFTAPRTYLRSAAASRSDASA